MLLSLLSIKDFEMIFLNNLFKLCLKMKSTKLKYNFCIRMTDTFLGKIF